MKKSIAIFGFLALFVSLANNSFAGYFNQAPIIHCDTQITKTLQFGSENNEVFILQQLLINAGFLDARPNGYFGYQTKSAVRSFQIANGILPTGSVGPSTRNAINERLCDTDLVDNTYSYNDSYDNSYFSSGVTYVSPNDPFVNVRVVNPTPSTPAIYQTPQSVSSSVNFSNIATPVNSSVINNQFVTPPSVSVLPANTQSSMLSTGVVYNPQIGYTYGITPQSGSVTITTPQANTIYNEGDVVDLHWFTSNLKTNSFTISLESSLTGQSKVVGITSSDSYSFTLTKDLLDSVCFGVCSNNQTGSFKIVISTPYVDIAGNTSTLKASVASVTVRRPLAPSSVSITTSKTPVNSGEVFKLYINIPTGASWNTNLAGNYSVKIKAICPSMVNAMIAGAGCGQDFVIPLGPTSFQQEIPATIINATWYRQDVTFELTVSNLLGQVIGTSNTKVTVNGAPFSW